MSELNLPPFYVGQKVVSLIQGKNDTGCTMNKGKVYIVKGHTQCKCGDWKIDIGLRTTKKGLANCMSCLNLYGAAGSGIVYVPSKFLAPVQENFQSISLEKVLEKETPLISVN